MFSFQNKTKYVLLEDKEQLESEVPSVQVHKGSACRSWLALILLLSVPFTTISTIFAIKHVIASSTPACESASVGVNVQCSQPPIRREWRTLSKADRALYIEAVQCLATRPSLTGGEGTIFDDFPEIHQTTVAKGHQSAPFFPWHRLYIHVYEKVLQEQCNYQGVLPYWDWSQDVNNFRNAPVWDDKFGFGGDGVVDGEVTVGEGRCVVDGPFTMITAKWYGEQEEPHCISRGFADEETLNELAELVHPDSIEALMEEPSFEKFAPELEHRAHKWITHTIRGEFSQYTGPNDPVFFLHHANLDRLWLQWQQKHSFTAYGGPQNMYDSSPASVDDVLDIGELHANITVAELMYTTSGMLCYQY